MNFLELSNSFKIGSLQISFYALCILTGLIIAVYLGLKEGKRLGITSNFIYLGVLIVVPIAIIGARLWYVIFNVNQFKDFAAVLGFEDGKFTGLSGLAIQGGVIFALITVYIYCRFKRVSFLLVCDIVAPGFLIGQILGRWGNFFNQELYGPEVSSEWYKNLLSNLPLFKDYMFINGAYRHPVFLYESFFNLCGLIFILVARRKIKQIKVGDFICIYLMWYGVVRIFTESLRLNSGVSEPLKLGPVPVSILISCLFIVGGIALFIIKRFIKKFSQEGYIDRLNYIKENHIDTVLFDNDGTLLDTKKLIFNSFIYTFEKFRPGYVLTDEELESFFGPTLYQSFSRYSEDENEIEEMIKTYREYNIPNHDSMVKAFPNAKELLKRLHKKGYKVGVVSSKKTDLLKHGLEVTGLLDYVDIVIGFDEVQNPKPAPDGILLAKEKLNGKNVCYVGDTLNDILAAKAANVKSVGCLYISNPEIMLEAKPDYVIDNLLEILDICGE